MQARSSICIATLLSIGMVAGFTSSAHALTVLSAVDDAAIIGGGAADDNVEFEFKSCCGVSFPLATQGFHNGSGGSVGTTVPNFFAATLKPYITFDLGSIGANPIVGADWDILTGAAVPTGHTINVYGVVGAGADDWNKTNITWNNAPGNDTTHAIDVLSGSVYGGTLLGTVVHTPSNTRVSFSNQDLIDYLEGERQGDGNATFIITAAVLGDNITFSGSVIVPGEEAHLTLDLGATGDFDGDGNVTTLDYDIMRANFLTSGHAFDEDGEVTGDGWVDLDDFRLFKDELFPGPASALGAAVPEPNAILLLLSAIPGWLLVTRRRTSLPYKHVAVIVVAGLFSICALPAQAIQLATTYDSWVRDDLGTFANSDGAKLPVYDQAFLNATTITPIYSVMQFDLSSVGVPITELHLNLFNGSDLNSNDLPVKQFATIIDPGLDEFNVTRAISTFDFSSAPCSS